MSPQETHADSERIKTGSLFRSLAIIALTGHTVILLATALVGIWPLVAINVFSIAIYGTALILNAQRLYVIVLGIGLVEVSIHAVVATAILGWTSGFHVYVLALIPLVFFFDRWPLSARASLAAVVVLGYVALAFVAYRIFPPDPRHFVEYFRYGNLFVGATVLAAISYYYGTTVSRAEIVLRSKNHQLYQLARTDDLTGLPNRREAGRLLAAERIRAGRSGTFAVALFDIDHFKAVNDTYGHDAGDLVLATIARAMRAVVRGQDVIGRWGGEEFLVLMPNTDREGALVAGEKIRAEVAAEVISFGASTLTVTVTAGVAQWTPEETVDQLVKRADLALYRGKEAGRDRVEPAPAPPGVAEGSDG